MRNQVVVAVTRTPFDCVILRKPWTRDGSLYKVLVLVDSLIKLYAPKQVRAVLSWFL